MRKRNKGLSIPIAVLLSLLALVQGGRVTRLTPTSGSLLGETRLTIHGEGFAKNQFNQFDKELGNNVTLVSNSRVHVLPCDVISYYTTPYQIVCTTRLSPSGEDSYNIRVMVDGKWLDNSNGDAYCGGECVFKFTKEMTPTITSLTPRYGLPGTLLTIRGRLFTDQVMETEGFDPKMPSIERVYAGVGLCDVKNPETEELYGIEIEDKTAKTGYIKCKPISTLIGSQRASFLVSGYGRSQMSKDAISVDSQDKLYLFQTHADVEEVSPSVGGIAGGTILTIRGKGFEKYAKSVSVEVAGVPCEILSIENEVIKCQTREAPPSLLDNGDLYPGARGLLREVWTGTRPSSVSAVGGLSTTALDYRSEVMPEASSPTQASFGESTSFSARFRGFFVPPSDNNYSFYIQADDQAELYLSLNESATAKIKIASCSKPTTSWTASFEQTSAVFSLKKGQRYYIEALHVQDNGKSHVKIGVKMQKTCYVNSQTGSAVNEKQEIRVNSVKHPEMQVINITSWDDGKKFEVQEVEVTPCNQSKGNGTIGANVFSLTYGGVNIGPLSLNNMTADNLQCALNNLTSVKKQGFVNVTEVVTRNNASAYRITFYFNNPEDTQMLQNVSSASNVTSVKIRRLQKGVRGNYWLKLSLAGRTSGNIHINASENDIKQQLENMSGWYCSYQTPPERAYYHNGFESPSQGPVWGDRVFNTRPNCGRFSLKNPRYLFYSGQTKDMWGRALEGYDVSRYKQLCFSYKGKINYINFRISYTDKSGADQRSWRRYNIVTIPDEKWHSKCINVHDQASLDDYLKTRADARYKMYVEVISVTRDSGVDLYIDDVFIWRDSVTVKRLIPAAEPGGNIIESVNVQNLGPSVWSVSITPASCGTGIELMQIAEATVISGNILSNQAIFKPINATGNSNIKISRDQAATPPIGGTFDIILENEKVTDISANVSADDLKSILENNFNVGKVSVTRVGTCASYNFTVEWATTGGDQPAVEVNGTGLTGNKVSIKARTIDDGGMFLRPILGDMLRVAETEPQVTVTVNNIPSSCSKRKCSFTFSSSATPVLTSISPQKGTTGTKITLTGSGFTSNVLEVNVTIGGSICQVSSSTLTTIKCTAGQSIGGSYNVFLKLGNKGFAKPSGGKISFTYRVSVNQIQPGKGSVGGGTVVTIKGNGFGVTPNGSHVTIGGSLCDVLNSSLTEISCVTSSHGPGNTNVDVTVGSEVGTLLNGFAYDSSLTPVVSSLSISEGSVSGGEELVIQGNGFGSSKTTIKIGPYPCRVTLHYDVLIKCITPANSPGIYAVLIYVDGKGYAVDARSGSRPPQFKYVLEVSDISPRYGSVFGGTVVTLTGRGFSDNASAVVVNIGDVPCEVLSSRSTKIMCKTGASSTVHTVDNTGVHPEYGLGYAWNPQTVFVNVGDFVQWKWISPELSGLSFGVQQTRDSVTTAYDGKGFKSARSGSGNFSHQFNLAGTYFYSSGAVDPYGAIIMKGRVIVNGLKTQSIDVNVQVGEVMAPYNVSGASPADKSSSDCQSGVTSAIPQCAAADLLPINQPTLRFTFWKCSTPEVTSISPNSGSSSTVLSIKGKGFGVDKCLNEVKIGSHDCVVQSSSGSEITCLVTTGNQLTAGIPHSVSVRVNNRGSAVIEIADNLNASFTLRPSIQSISPTTGSQMGGTILTIRGDGFSPDLNQTSGEIAGAPCKILSISYTQIQCRTPAKNASQALAVVVKVNGMESNCDSNVGCSFTYSAAKTPKVDSVTPSAIVGSENIIRMYGSGLPSRAVDLEVKIGSTSCVVTSSSQYSASCRVGSVVAGKHDLKIHVAGQGFAMFEAGASSAIDSLAIVSSIAPTEGSIMGGTELSIKGSGFDPTAGQTTVKIGANFCTTVRVTSSEVVCRTSAHGPGSYEVIVTASAKQFPRLRYAYRTFTTPYVTSVSPSRGKGGEIVTISGSGFSPNTANMLVTIGNSSCSIVTSSDTRLTCALGNRPAGIYEITLHVKGKGLAAYPTDKLVTFVYEISLDSISPNECGLGGGRVVSVKGHGFDSTTVVKICDNICRTINSSLNEIYCEVPAYTASTGNLDIPCSVSVVGEYELTSSKPSLFKYRESLTSRITSVSPSRGGTGGGVQLTIKGNGFSANQDGNKVTIAGIPCKITTFSQTEIRCTTGPRKGTIQTKVRVEVGNQGIATQDHGDFQYIDVWSSRYTWGNKSPPGKGDAVEILKAQTILLDVDTPVFSVLVIRGELIFDEKDLTLNAEKILVVDGGRLQVGTEAKPFQHKAKLVLHGHVHSKRLPIFGTKVLAVREGTLDLHGKVVPITWTHLAKTALPGDTQLVLKQGVTWNVGDQVVLTSTSRSPEENEEFNITSISSDGRTIGIDPSVRYKHISLVQTIAGRQIETRAEVGLLTRNVVVEGSENDEWSEKIPECPEDFDPGIFAVQTCYQGRYGDAMASEQFGSQIMINAKMQSEGLVTGRISYVEVRKAGQAFGLGRYPIHFHLSGDVSGSYVRGCAIHHTFNRAVTVHGVTGLVVEHNVAYHVMGHAFFIEDGIETGNTIQYNLGVFVQTSSTLLITDVTPATFWVTNPNNTIRHNAAAGGSHHGYWYNLPTHPGGPSFTTSVCPQNAPLGEFQNNTAHSFGRYGVWIFQDYFPKRGGGCDSTVSEPAKFYTLLAYNNLKGFELTNGGAIQTINFTVIDNKEAGIEFTKVEAPWGEKGPLVKEALVVGHSAVSASSSACTQGGLVAPQSSRLTVSGTTFVNFDAPSCAALRACSFCKPREGGFSTRFEKTRFVNSPNKAAFKWEHEGVFEDLDGTLTGLPGGGSILPSNPNLPPKHCSQSPSVSVSPVPGSVCDATMRFRRMSWNDALPTSLKYRNALLTNEAGTSHIPWRFMRVTHNEGWMATVILGQNYNFSYENAPQLTNISYSAVFYEFGEKDFIWMTHPMKQVPDMISTSGKFVNMTSGIPSAENALNGDWYFNNEAKELTYIVSGRGGGGLVDRSIQLQVTRCFFKNCIKPIPPPPPEKRPIEYLRWSDPEAWYGTDPGYGGYNKQLPQDGDDVIIKQHWWMVADTELPSMRKLFIYGTLELEPYMDFVLKSTYIVVGHGGNLIIGWEDQPMIGSVLISLSGNWDTPDIPIQDGPNVGTKAIGVFGNLEIHGLNRSVYWTRLSKTADPGSTIIYLAEAVDWKPGEEIVIAPTSFEPYDTEILKIVNVGPDRKTLQLNRTLKYRHLSESYTTGKWNYTLAAEVGLLTRNIVIEGADDANQVLYKQSFGCRVLIGSFGGSDTSNRRVRVENVEFRHCGQEGWSDEFDPRYSLALLDVGNLKSSYVRGNSFHDGFNTAIGVFGTDRLTVVDNVIHHTVGSAVRVWGSNNKVLRNLAVLSVSPATYKGRHEDQNQLWHASFDISKASRITLRNNAAAGSERIGFHIRGESCYVDNPGERWDANTAHTTLHGIHIGYEDGFPGCLKIAKFLSWKNWDYGVFGYPSSRVVVEDTVVVDSNIGILINVWAPPSLSHASADKFVRLDRVLIVGTSPSFDCASDSVVPRNSDITDLVRAPRYSGGGNTGFMLTTFCSSLGLAPEKPWHMVITYPAIRGVVKLNHVGFAHFGTKCGKNSVAVTTNPGSPDVFHPVLVQGISMYNVDSDKMFYIPPSNIEWINPSDCVDMDCDGTKHVIIKDLDGSLTGVSGGSVISKAEYEWNGDPRRGLGDYRIPRAMLTSLDGSRLNASVVAPHHGIVRGTRTQSFCSWNAAWNAYKCSKLDYHMLVIESLDGDTELRRLSPVAVSSNGYIDLLNGPMDQGCCFGYACMERISTFYSVVATQNNYTVYFTGTNPQNLRLTLLNADNSQAVRVAIWYSTPQRLDVYRAGVYVYPTNAKLDKQNFGYKEKDPKLPDDQFEPPLSSISGANYYDRKSQLLYVVVKGNVALDIRTAPVIQVKLGSKPVHFNDFFEKNLIQNLASLLNIDESRIRVVEIVNAAGDSRRRRRNSDDKPMTITIEIGDPPQPRIPYTPEEKYTPGNFSSTTPPPVTITTTASPTQTPDDQYIALQSLASKTVEAAQTGHMASSFNLDIISVEVTDPEPPRKLPKGWKRATPEDAGPKNGTWRFDQVKSMKEGNKSSPVHDYLIPVRLVVMREPHGANETVPFLVQPKLVMVDKLNRTVSTLGHGYQGQWYVTASIKSGTGDPEALLGGNTTVSFIDGWANFTNLNISHNGTDYVLEYNITFPLEANFTAVSEPFEVKERILYFTLVDHPRDSNETVPFSQQPLVEVRDAANGELVTNTGWKGRKWICKASLVNPQSYKGKLNGSAIVEFLAGVASFTDLSIDHEDKNYVLNIEAVTIPPSRYQFSKDTDPFNVSERILALVITQQPADCNDTVICGSQPILEIRDTATNSMAGNLGWRGRKWTIKATMERGAGNDVIIGTTRFQIPRSGRAEFSNISFYDVANGYRMKFEVTVTPHSQSYSGMVAVSNTFNVNPRQFYLEVVTQVANANQSVIFGTQPVVEVRDLGTGKRAAPLKNPWQIAVTLYSSPKVGQAFLNGTSSVSVVKERAAFKDLLVTVYGRGYVLKFESNYGHSILSAPFEVYYVNDYSPVFAPSSSNYIVNVSESVSIGSDVINIHATDKDKGSQGDVYYAVTRGNIGNSFSINRTSGAITIARKLDREKTGVYDLIVKAYDGAVTEKVRFTEGHVTVNIGDINDNAPHFTKKEFTTSVKETADLNDVILRVNALDRDAGTNAELKFSITSGNVDGYFDVIPATGDIIVKKSLDLEGVAPPSLNHSLGVHVTDLGVPQRSNFTNVIINILPVNEFSPQFSHSLSAKVRVKENQGIGNGLVLIDVNATDRDFGQQGKVHYFIFSGNSDRDFTVNSSSGVVMLISPLDYEAATNHTLIIRASDTDLGGHARFADFTLQILVDDVNDNSPKFANHVTLIEVPETLSIGQTATTIQATDLDSGENGRVTYSVVSGDSSGYFSLHPNTGELTTLKSLDLESAQNPNWTFTLVIVAKDHGNPQLSGIATFVLKVSSVNEFTPEFTQPGLSLNIPEDTAVGTMLCHLTATDKDFGPDGLVTYQITEGNDDRRFRADPSTGQIYVHAPLDRETTPIYHLKIKAFDRPTLIANQRSSFVFVSVALADVNDNKPVFKAGSFYAAVKETAGVGDDIITVEATDSDAGTNGQIEYKIKSGNRYGFFEINANTGTITIKSSLDLETQKHVDDLLYTLTVEAWDRGTPVSLSNDVLVTIEIQSVNEFPPKLQHPDSIYVKISEDVPVGSKIADINATDKDFGLDGKLTYSIFTGNEGNKFVVNPNTGVISVNNELDYETVVRYSLGVRISDNAPPAQRLSTVAKVTIRLTNVNDSGGVDVLIQDVRNRITPPGDPAQFAGVETSSPISVVLLYENGKREKLSADDSRLIFDDKSESRGLFTVVQSYGKKIIEANRAGLLGQGILIVRVHNVHNVRVKINVVGYSSLQLKAVTYPLINQSNATLTTLKRVGSHHGNFQQAALKLFLVLTDNSTYDVSTMTSASFSVVSNDVGVKVFLGPSWHHLPKNVLYVDTRSISGKLSVCGKFSGKISQNLDLEVSTDVITVDRMISVELSGLTNQTLLGLAYSTKAEIQVDFLMNDSSVFRVQDFMTFSGLVTFTVSNAQVASVGSVTGIVTLKSDYHDFVTVTVTPLQGLVVPKVVQFYCNTLPPVGGVDIGQEFGPALPLLTANRRITIPVRVNQGKSKLLAYDVKISYDQSQVRLVELKRASVYSHIRGQLHLADVTLPDSASSHIADLVFDTLSNGVLSIQASVNRLLDQRLGHIGRSNPNKPSVSECTTLPLGNVNADCVFDIQDAAFTMAYSLAQEKDFVGEFEQTLLKRTTAKMLKVMDFNRNGVIERNDAFLLARANLDMARFVHDFHVTTPDHQNESTHCALKITTKLSTRAGNMDTNSNTQVFFEFASGNKILSSQLKNTAFGSGELITTYDDYNELFGGIVKAESRDEGFQVKATESQIEISNMGLSMIQVIEDSQRLDPAVTPLFIYSPAPSFPSSVRIGLTPTADLVFNGGHSPQMRVNITESYATCQDPPVTNNVMFVFQNDYTEVKGKEDAFTKIIIGDLTEKFPWIKIENVRLAPGSIRVYFDVITQKSRIKTTLVALWDMVNSGYTLRAGDTEYQAKPVMRVDGKDYHGNDELSEADQNSKFPVGAIVGVCVVVTVAVIGAVVYLCYKKRVVQRKDGFKWKSASKINILNSRSTSRLSSETRDHEMILFSGLSNDHFESSDDEMSPSPAPSSRNSLAQILKPEENFAKRKLRKVESASSQVSIEAWAATSSPALLRHQMEVARQSPQPRVSSPNLGGSSPVGRLLSKQTSDSQLLVQENSSTDGSPLDLSPQVPKRGQSPNKRRLLAQNSLNNKSSDSSDEEPVRSETSSPVKAHTSGRRSLTPQNGGSKLTQHDPEAFIFDKAVLHKKLKSQESESKLSSHTGSHDSSRSGSGYSTPRVNVMSLPPGFMGNNGGNDITIEEESYTVRLPVNVLNTVKEGEGGKPFTKIGFIEFPSDATLRELREKLKKDFKVLLEGKVFLFQDAMMADVEPSTEETTKIMYNLSVIIRLANNQEAARLFCPCGAAAHFQCSACHKRGYCGRDCQLKDWRYHKTKCASAQSSTV